MNTTHSLFLTCAMAAVSLSSLSQADKTPPVRPDDNSTDTKADILLLDKWRHVGFHLISDWQGGEVDSVLDDPTLGFALTYMKHDRKGIFDGGLDLGFQPIGGFDTTVVVDDNGEEKMGTLTVRNQLVHAHYLLRLTLFQNGKIQPFGEGFAGMRGSLWVHGWFWTTRTTESQSMMCPSSLPTLAMDLPWVQGSSWANVRASPPDTPRCSIWKTATLWRWQMPEA